MDNDDWVPRAQYDALLGMAARQPAQRKSGWLTDLATVALWLVNGFACIVLIWVFAPMVLGGTPAQPPPSNAQGTPYPTAPLPRQPIGAPVAQPPSGALPNCDALAAGDTRTACQPDEPQPAPAAVEQLPTEAPAPTATPPYLANCWTEPGERPCWLPADQPWAPPADVPATPIVAVDEGWHAPLVAPADVCADWHPPAPYPEGCGDE